MSEATDNILRDAGVDLSTRQTIGDVDFFSVKGGQLAVDLWHALRPRLSAAGAWPVLCGDAKEFDHFEEQIEDGEESFADVLARVPSGPPLEVLRRERREASERMREWYRQQQGEVPAFLDEEDPAPPDLDPPEFDRWPSEPEASASPCAGAFDYTGRPLEACRVAVVATADPAEAPALLRFGGFNECPMPETHVGFIRDWNRRYGAVPMTITHDVIELFVDRPIPTPAEAWQVATEQYEYCTDIVDQGTETVESLAQAIWRSPMWFFWWD